MFGKRNELAMFYKNIKVAKADYSCFPCSVQIPKIIVSSTSNKHCSVFCFQEELKCSMIT